MTAKIMIPANHSEAIANHTDNVGLIIAGVLMLAAVSLVCLLAFAGH